jgi:uncharacterized protein YbgA (DUF1722 family)/uncharacterized protein YbbK (DUF523 family)
MGTHCIRGGPVIPSKPGMHEKIKLGISSCLLGEKVRYDGGHKLDPFLRNTLGRYVDWVPICPEVESGLPVPRDAMHLVGDPDAPRLVTINTGTDHTNRMLRWANEKLSELERMDLCGFVFKSRSPSSGMRGVKLYTPEGVLKGRSIGIFAGAFMQRFPLLPVEDDGRLQDPALRENFIERVFVFRRWQEYVREESSLGGLVSFHTMNKLLTLAHSPKHYTALGKLVAEAKRYRREAFHEKYITTLMEGLRLIATSKKNTNVLQHMTGYLKKQLSSDEKQELQDVIENYHSGLVPLIVPLTLLQHHVRKYNVEYLKKQYYLNPHPIELMLRNHI